MDIEIESLKGQISTIEELKLKNYKNVDFDKWIRKTERILKRVFGENCNHIDDFNEIINNYSYSFISIGGGSIDFSQSEYIRNLESAKCFLESCIEEVEENSFYKSEELNKNSNNIVMDKSYKKIDINGNKKLQVFVSSTYIDLIEERQVAVKAILDSGHIPAGMELFKSGKGQMETIKKWIDESDIYMLILGGRYGSIESESGKSYTHLEYEYAEKRGLPIFSVIAKDNLINQKVSSANANCGNVEAIMELENRKEYEIFKSYVKNKICGFFEDNKDIETEVHKQINAIEKSNELVGWIRFENVQEEFKKLVDENKKLKKTIGKDALL